MMALASLRTPSPAKAGSDGGQRGRSGEPFGEEAKAFTRQNLLQRTVEVRRGRPCMLRDTRSRGRDLTRCV